MTASPGPDRTKTPPPRRPAVQFVMLEWDRYARAPSSTSSPPPYETARRRTLYSQKKMSRLTNSRQECAALSWDSMGTSVEL